MSVTEVTYRTHVTARQAMNAATRDRFRRHCRPRPKLTLSQWAERYREIPEGAAHSGKWRNHLAPYLVPIMDAITDPNTEEVTIVAPSQSGKSEVALNAIGYYIHQEPSPILLVQFSVDEAKSFSKDRIQTMIKATPALRPLVSPVKSRDSKNTIRSKSYPGGQIDIVGANSAAGLASRPKRVVILDERDRHPRSAGKEGDVKGIAYARTTTFKHRKKIIEISSPTTPEESLIWPSYEEATQEVFEVPCPHCGYYQTLEWPRLKWTLQPSGLVDPRSVHYECANCKGQIRPEQRPALYKQMRHRATAQTSVPRKRSFRIHGLLAAFETWYNLASLFVSYARIQDLALRAEKLKTFFNTKLGELWIDQESESFKAKLLERAQRYDTRADEDVTKEQPRWQVPREVALLAAGMDVQHNRVEIAVMGYGVGETSWLIEYVILRGDTSQPAFWANVETWRTHRTWKHESGGTLQVRALAVDASDGTHSKTIYAYTGPRRFDGVFALKGSTNPGAPLLPLKATKVTGGKLYVCGVNGGMDRLYRRLQMATPGPGFIHLNEYATEAFLTQLLSMRRVLDPKTSKRRWEKNPNIPNEVPDAVNYAYLAFLLGPVPVEQLAVEVDRVNEEGAAELIAATLPPRDPTAAPPTDDASTDAGDAGGWLYSWKR